MMTILLPSFILCDGKFMGIYLEVSRKTHGRYFHRGSLDYNQKKSSNDLVDLQIYYDSSPIIFLL